MRYTIQGRDRKIIDKKISYVLKVMKEITAVFAHFFFVDQFCGFKGSLSPSQKTMLLASGN